MTRNTVTCRVQKRSRRTVIEHLYYIKHIILNTPVVSFRDVKLQRTVGQILLAVVIVGSLAIVAGSALGQPVLLSYVETGSMEPTIDAGDGFVAVPAEVAGPVEEGDVVVFRAEEVNGGRLTTHRVVEETDRGYVTKGDANPFTDQDGKDEPPVKDGQVVAKALQVGGHVVVVPHLGTAVEGVSGAIAGVQRWAAMATGTGTLLGVQGVAYLFFAGTVVLYAVDAYRDDGTKARERGRSRDDGTDVRVYAAAFALLVVVGATAAMVVPAGTQEFGIVSAEFDSDRPDVVRAGETANLTYGAHNGGVVPVHAVLEPGSEGVDVRPREARVGSGEQVNASLSLAAPPETGYYRYYVVEHRYLALLPTPVIRGLHGVHPWVPIVALDALLGVPVYLFTVWTAGTGRVRNRSRDGARSLGSRLRAALWQP